MFCKWDTFVKFAKWDRIFQLQIPIVGGLYLLCKKTTRVYLRTWNLAWIFCFGNLLLKSKKRFKDLFFVSKALRRTSNFRLPFTISISSLVSNLSISMNESGLFCEFVCNFTIKYAFLVLLTWICWNILVQRRFKSVFVIVRFSFCEE